MTTPTPKPRRPRLTAKVARELISVVQFALSDADRMDGDQSRRKTQREVFDGCGWILKLIEWHEARAEKRK